jgi:RNA polymerase sigma-70 factor (ECF subfamily)
LHDEETELMLRVAAGDESAFEPLVGRVLPRLVGYFRRLGAERHLAEDCAQEVLVKVYRIRAQYEPRAKFVTYLFHVARNHWIDVYRHLHAGPRVTLAGSGAESGGEDRTPAFPPARGAEPSADAVRGEVRAALARAIRALGTEHREVFVLAQVEALRYEDIAAILGIPVGTVKSRMHTAVRQVREALRREGIEP